VSRTANPAVVGIVTLLASIAGGNSALRAAEAVSATYVLESSTMTMMAVTAESPTYTMTVTAGQPLAAGPLASTVYTASVGFLNDLDSDGDGVGGALDLCPNQYAGCNDTNGDGCIDIPDPDGDGDGVGRGACDCDDTNAQIWGRPGEVLNVRFASATSIVWDPPAGPGGSQPRYDVIRSANPSDFVASGACIESDDFANTSAGDPATPVAGQAFFYVIRAENGCALGIGPLGLSTGGYQRAARSCP